MNDRIDILHSKTDPFQQLSAPDLSELIPDAERQENVQYIFASEVKKSPPITLSEFNSQALIVEEPPKVLTIEDSDKEKTNLNTFDTEKTNLNTLTKVIQQPFKNFLPSFLTGEKQPAVKEKVQVAGSLPVSVRDSSSQPRLPAKPRNPPPKSRFPLLGTSNLLRFTFADLL